MPTRHVFPTCARQSQRLHARLFTKHGVRVVVLALAFATAIAAGAPPGSRADDCRHTDVVSYTTDTQRLAAELGKAAAPCADYYISIQPGNGLPRGGAPSRRSTRRGPASTPWPSSVSPRRSGRRSPPPTAGMRPASSSARDGRRRVRRVARGHLVDQRGRSALDGRRWASTSSGTWAPRVRIFLRRSCAVCTPGPTAPRSPVSSSPPIRPR